MERDTIAQRLSALRKEVFMTPHSPVSDPSRPIGGSRLTQQPSVTQARRQGDASPPPDGSPPSRLRSVSPRPNASAPLQSSPLVTGSGSPTRQSQLGGAVLSSAAERSGSGHSKGMLTNARQSPRDAAAAPIPTRQLTAADADVKWASSRPSASSRAGGPVRVDVRLAVSQHDKGGRPAGLAAMSGTQISTRSSRARGLEALPVRHSNPRDGSPGPCLGDVGGSPVEPCDSDSSSPVRRPHGSRSRSPSTLPAMSASEKSPEEDAINVVMRTASAVPDHVVAASTGESRSRSAPMAPISVDLDGPRALDQVSPRAVARKQQRVLNLETDSSTSQSPATPEAAASAAPPASKRKSTLVVSLLASDVKKPPITLMPPSTPIVGLTHGELVMQQSMQPALVPVRPNESWASPSIVSPRKSSTHRSISVVTPTSAHRIELASDISAAVKDDTEHIRAAAPASLLQPVMPGERRSAQPGASSPRCAVVKLTPKAMAPSVQAAEVPAVMAPAGFPTLECKLPTTLLAAPASASSGKHSVKRGTFSFDDDDIVASDLAHGLIKDAEVTPGGTAVSVAPVVAFAGNALVTPDAATPSSRRRKPNLSIPVPAPEPSTGTAVIMVTTGPAQSHVMVPAAVVPDGSEPRHEPAATTAATQQFSPYPAGLHFDVDVDLLDAAVAAAPVEPARRLVSVPTAKLVDGRRSVSPETVPAHSRRPRRSHRSRHTLPEHLRAYEVPRVSSSVLETLMRGGRESWREYRDSIKIVRGECEYMGAIPENGTHRSLLAPDSRPGKTFGGLRALQRVPSPSDAELEAPSTEESVVADDWHHHATRGWQKTLQSAFFSHRPSAASLAPASTARDALPSKPVRKLSVKVNNAGSEAAFLLASPVAVALKAATPNKRVVKPPPSLKLPLDAEPKSAVPTAVTAVPAVPPAIDFSTLLASPVSASRYASLSRPSSSASLIASSPAGGTLVKSDATASGSTLRSLKDSSSGHGSALKLSSPDSGLGSPPAYRSAREAPEPREAGRRLSVSRQNSDSTADSGSSRKSSSSKSHRRKHSSRRASSSSRSRRRSSRHRRHRSPSYSSSGSDVSVNSYSTDDLDDAKFERSDRSRRSRRRHADDTASSSYSDSAYSSESSLGSGSYSWSSDSGSDERRRRRHSHRKKSSRRSSKPKRGERKSSRKSSSRSRTKLHLADVVQLEPYQAIDTLPDRSCSPPAGTPRASRDAEPRSRRAAARAP